MAFKRWSGGGVRATAILDGGCARCHWAQAGRDGETALRSNKEPGPKDRKILGQHTTFLTKCPIQGWAKAPGTADGLVYRPCAPLPTPSDFAIALTDRVAKAEAKSCRHRNASAAFAHLT